MSDSILNDANRVIEAFGGIRPMAKKLGVAVTTVQGWKERNAIPVQRLDQIREAAKREGISLDSARAPGKPDTGKAEAPKSDSQSASTASRTAANTSAPSDRTAGSAAGGREAGGASADAKAQRVAAEKVSSVSPGVKSSATTSSATTSSATTSSAGSGTTLDGKAKSPPDTGQPKRSRAFAFGLGFAAVLLIGAAAGWYLKDYWLQGSGDSAAVAALQKRVADAQAAAQAAAKSAGALASRLKAAEASLADISKNSPSGAAVRKLADDLKALRAEVGDVKKAGVGSGSGAASGKLAADLAKLQATVDALQKAAGDAKSATSGTADSQTKSAIDKLTAGLAALETRIASLSKSRESAGSVDTLVSKIAALENRLKSVEAGGGKANVVVAISQLRAQAASGKPYETALAVAAKLAGTDSPATPVLNSLKPAAGKGAPTLPVLQQRFDALSSDLVAAAMRAQGKSWTDRAWNKLKSTVVVRRTGRNVKGNSPDALVAQADVKLADGDLPGAVALVRKLPRAAQASASAWLADADRRIAIDAALSKLDALMPTLSGAAASGAAK